MREGRPIRALSLFLSLFLTLASAPGALAGQGADPPRLPPGQELEPEEAARHIGRMGDHMEEDAGEGFSDAETRLWLSNHLGNITEPMQLYYEFTKEGKLEEEFSDAVYLDILALNEDGSKNADMQFFTGARRQSFHSGNVTGVVGNPVLGIYLQGDVYEMSRLTEGGWRHFHRRIKLALHESAEVRPTTISFAGQQLQAQVIAFAPYRNDPYRSRFEKYSNKRYEITLSDQVPGTLYRIRTVIRDAGEQTAEPLLAETLTLVSTRPLQP